MLVVVTAGGVKEKIDNVRSITNSSTGKLGLKIVKEFLRKERNVEIICIHGVDAVTMEDSRVKNIKIRGTQELLEVVTDVLTCNKVDVFVHSMAVADYTTSSVIDIEKLKENLIGLSEVTEENFEEILKNSKVESNSKISSYMDRPAVVLTKTPKVIEQIKKISPYTFLVGFKLLDTVSEDELFDVGFNLLRKNRCNLVLANDISLIRAGEHKGMIIYPEKTFDFAYGKDEIAKILVEKIIDRYNVGHPKSIEVSKNNCISDEIFEEFKKMGVWLNQNDFLPRVINHNRVDKVGTYGNMSLKKWGKFYITSRNVDKSNLNKENLSLIDNVEYFEGENIYSNVYYNSIFKPSIDTTIHSKIYTYSIYSHIVHIHTSNVFLGYPFIDETYTCGCDKECNAIVDIVKENSKVQVIQMKKHGLIILGNSFNECKDIIEDLFNNQPYINYSTNDISEDCVRHIKEVQPAMDMGGFVFPLMIGNKDIGFLYEKIDYKVHFGLYTMENVRGKGLNIVKKYLSLYTKPYILHTTKACEIADFYVNKYAFNAFDLVNENDLQYIR